MVQNFKGEIEYKLNLYRPYLSGFRITSKFGQRKLRNFFKSHKGTDYVGEGGKTIYSIGKAKVLRTGYQANGAGNYVVCSSTWYLTDIEIKYFHLSKIFVEIDQLINQGDEIGIEGNTGHSTGSHLHLEIWVEGKAIDPEGKDVKWIGRG